MNYLFFAYGVAWGLLALYLIRLECRQRSLARRIADLEAG
ncbi:MAG: CcmD family protein [Acidobacteriota bacterium]|jgi:CcmD family protein|nr:MAG: CcmD family protein [Acidobacteriota bacterium]